MSPLRELLPFPGETGGAALRPRTNYNYNYNYN